ncbi:hypothetical protein BOX15_Mlig026860g1, partial [Macrostomum lignano]
QYNSQASLESAAAVTTDREVSEYLVSTLTPPVAGNASTVVSTAAAPTAEFLPGLTILLGIAVIVLSLILLVICCRHYCPCCRWYRRDHRFNYNNNNNIEQFYDHSDASVGGAFLHDALVGKKHVPVIFAEELEAAAEVEAMSLGTSRPMVLPVERPPVEMPAIFDDEEENGEHMDADEAVRMVGGVGSFERLRYGNKPPPPPP